VNAQVDELTIVTPELAQAVAEATIDATVPTVAFASSRRRITERDSSAGYYDAIIEGDLMITEGILPRLSDIEHPANVYTEGKEARLRFVDDFTVRTPKVMDGPNHVAELCICLHPSVMHYSKLGASTPRLGDMHDSYQGFGGVDDRQVTDACTGRKLDGSPCGCGRMNPVSPKASKHAYHRGQKVLRRRASDVMPGQRVLVGWAPTTQGRVRLTEQKTGAMVATVVSKRGKLPPEEEQEVRWNRRMWLIVTDLGESLPIAGGDLVGVVVS
jgi:hypothetical protein